MPFSKHTHVIKFNQMTKLSDLRYIGNCYAYVVLFVTYLLMFNLKNKNSATKIDYSALLEVLNSYDTHKKHLLNGMPSFYHRDYTIDYKAILDEEVAIFNQNSGDCEQTEYFSEFCQKLYENLENFGKPTFYFLHYFGKNVLGMPVTHIVGIYVVSA